MLSNYPTPTIKLEYSTKDDDSLRTLLGVKRGYDPTDKGCKMMSKEELECYLFLFRTYSVWEYQPLDVFQLNNYGFDVALIDSLQKRCLVDFKSTAKKNHNSLIKMYHPDHALSHHPDVVDKRKAKGIEDHLAMKECLATLNEVAKEIGIEKFKAKLIQIMRD
ncbi:hypothetical protein ABDC18_002856 [Escherichia coli]